MYSETQHYNSLYWDTFLLGKIYGGQMMNGQSLLFQSLTQVPEAAEDQQIMRRMTENAFQYGGSLKVLLQANTSFQWWFVGSSDRLPRLLL